MLYSLSYESRGGTERRMFYAQDEEEARQIVRTYSESQNIPLEEIRLKTHPKGFHAGYRIYPPEEREKA